MHTPRRETLQLRPSSLTDHTPTGVKEPDFRPVPLPREVLTTGSDKQWPTRRMTEGWAQGQSRERREALVGASSPQAGGSLVRGQHVCPGWENRGLRNSSSRGEGVLQQPKEPQKQQTGCAEIHYVLDLEGF